jgi:hypothetical protein
MMPWFIVHLQSAERFMVIPIDSSLLYVEPVYIRAEHGKLPGGNPAADGASGARAEHAIATGRGYSPSGGRHGEPPVPPGNAGSDPVDGG